MRVITILIGLVGLVLIPGCGTNSARTELQAKSDLVSTVDLFKVCDGVFARLGKVGYDSLNRPEQVFVCIWELEADVNNGGFDQYYFNDAGDRALNAVESLEAIGASRTATLVNQANRVFGASGPSRDRGKRQEQLDSLTEAHRAELAKLDVRYLTYEENLESLLRAFVVEHSDVLGKYLDLS